jgi:OOP family OmpA-OmpF porin
MQLVLALLLALLLPAVQQPSSASSLEAEINKTGGALVYGVGFDPGTASLQTASERVLREIVVLMREHTDWRFEVQGHTHASGAPDRALDLSSRRARTVVDWLVAHGINADRLVAKGYGDTRPVSTAPNDESHLLNDRVQLRKLNEE